MRAILAALLAVAPALAGAQGAIGVGVGGGAAVPLCTGSEVAFGVCLDAGTGALVWEGATADAFEAGLVFADPTVDSTLTFNTNALTAPRTITWQNASGTVPLLEAQNTWTTSQILSAGLYKFNDGTGIRFGTGNDTFMRWDTVTNPDVLMLGLGADSNVFHILENADVGQVGFNNCWAGSSTSTNPGICIHSANVSTTEWLGFYHDQTNGLLETGTGGLDLTFAGSQKVRFASGGLVYFGVNATNGLRLGSDDPITWSNNTSPLIGTIATGIAWDSAGVLRISDGSTGRGSLIVGGAAQLQLGDDGTKPTCSASTRGTIWYDAGGAGVADTLEVCRKDAGDAYAWVTLF